MEHIVGRGSRSAIGTPVDRTCRYVKLVHLPDARSAVDLQAAMAKVMTTLAAQAWRTLTCECGTKSSEMARHDRIAFGFPTASTSSTRTTP